MSNYQVHVSASPKSMRDDSSLPHALMHVTYIIRSMYKSSSLSPSPSSPICDHCSKQHFECAPFVSTDDSPGSPSWGFISFTLDNLRLPFRLDRLRRIDLDGRSGAGRTDQGRDEIVSQILSVACRVVNDPRNKGRKRFGVLVDMEKVVTLPENEIQEMGRSDIAEMLRRFEMASEPAIPGLEEAVILKHRDPSEVCGICLEEQALGDVVSRLACSHEFHSCCIEKWLKIAHTCPTCPPDPSEVCGICLEAQAEGDVVSRLVCSHEFHSSCIEKWLKIAHTCPTCRHKLPTRRNLAS